MAAARHAAVDDELPDHLARACKAIGYVLGGQPRPDALGAEASGEAASRAVALLAPPGLAADMGAGRRSQAFVRAQRR